MEGLRQLGKVSRTMDLLERHCPSRDPANARFMADFLLFLSDACEDAAEMASKYNYLASQLPKVSATNIFHDMTSEKATKGEPLILQDLKTLLGSDTHMDDRLTSSETKNATMEHLIVNKMQSSPMVELSSMERARTTLEDFCRSYFMFHDMDACNPDHVFRYLPVLFFVESYIYQLDGLNEEHLLPEYGGATFIQNVSCSSLDLACDPFSHLRDVLADRGLLTKRIIKELEDGREYWALERSLCISLSLKKQISMADVSKAIRLKSFDYRVLNLLLYQICNAQVNEAHMEFLSVSELLVEISDDLFDYEEDVLNNNFNVLRMFVYKFGPTDAPGMLAQFISEAEEEYRCLLEGLETTLAFRYKKRCEEAVAQGGCPTKHRMGTWTIPPLISDEEAYRSQVHQ